MTAQQAEAWLAERLEAIDRRHQEHLAQIRRRELLMWMLTAASALFGMLGGLQLPP